MYRFDAVLLHPMLEVLTIYNAEDGCTNEVLEQKSSTALQTLEILDSSFSVAELTQIVAIPRALKGLAVHQNPLYPNPTILPDWSEHGEMLKVVEKSLEKLFVGQPDVHLSPFPLRNMVALRHVAFDDDELWFGHRWKSVETMDESWLSGLIPPNLEMIYGLNWAYCKTTSRHGEEWLNALSRVLSIMKRLAPALGFGFYSPLGINEGFKYACAASDIPITYTYNEYDLFDYHTAVYIRTGPLLSLPVGPIDDDPREEEGFC